MPAAGRWGARELSVGEGAGGQCPGSTRGVVAASNERIDGPVPDGLHVVKPATNNPRVAQAIGMM